MDSGKQNSIESLQTLPKSNRTKGYTNEEIEQSTEYMSWPLPQDRAGRIASKVTEAIQNRALQIQPNYCI